MEEYDIVVIGAGSGGLTTAVGFSKVGKKVLLVEREHMGGECTNSGCIPSKALLHHAKSYHAATEIAGTSTQSQKYRAEAFTYVRNKIEEVLEEETPETFKKIGIDVVMGEASFHTKCSVEVNGAVYGYKKAIIATGSSPRMMEIVGLNSFDILTNQNIFDLKDVPEKLLIIGSGPIGMEMAQAFAMLGSKVTIATIDSRFARLEDEKISSIIQKKFEDLGIKIHLNAFIKKVENGEAVFDIKEDDKVTGEAHIPFDKVLVTIGRAPNLPEGLDTAGIKAESYGVVVDKQHRTSNKYVYAVGDVAQKLKFTHTADDIGRQVVMHVLSKGFIRLNTKKAVPKVTYTQPEMAQVGLSHAAALEKYCEEEIVRIEVLYTANDRANTDSNNDGMMIVIARRLNGAVIGAHIIGPAAGEMISVFTIAIDRKISMWQLRRTIYAYPTYSLLIKKTGDYFFAMQMASLKKDLMYLVKKHILKLIVGSAWVAGLWQLYAYQEASGMNTTQTALMLFDFVSMTVWGPLLYIVIYAIRPLTFFPATALSILSGVFFGLVGGTFLTVIAANLSAALAYVVGRFFGKNLKLEDSLIGNWVEALRKNSFEAVLTMRLIFLPFDGVSYMAGILKTPFFSFMSATFIGTLLGIATFVAIGASLDIESFKENGFSTDVINLQFLLISAGVFIISLLLSKVLKRWKAKS